LLLTGDRLLRDLATLALGRVGLEVTSTAEVTEAGRILRQETVHLALIDLLLPTAPDTSAATHSHAGSVANGLDLLLQYGREGLLTRTPVIVISALGFREIVSQAVEAGAVDFLVKPIQPDVLIARVQLALQRAAGLTDAAPNS
jgi:two-component system response regulator PilR (NtrC family)